MILSSNDVVYAPAFPEVFGGKNLYIAEETPADCGARERLLDAAFGTSRFDKTAERLREGRFPVQGLALAAKDADGLIGTLRMWYILAGEVPALLLGPLAVAKAYRSRGLGRRLMRQALFRGPRGIEPFCSSVMRPIMNLSGLPGGIRLAFRFPVPSMRRASSG
jgi:GNAT superfamily N-acetyltransferase